MLLTYDSDWIEIHPQFEFEKGWTPYPQLWVEEGLTRQDAQEWIAVGLSVDDYKMVYYLKNVGITPEQFANKFKEQNNAQELIDLICSSKKIIKKTFLHLVIGNKILIGSLNFPKLNNLTELHCSNSKLSSLNISQCESLDYLDCSKNQLISLILPQEGGKIAYLDVSYNQLTDLTIIGQLKNLRELNLSHNPLTGSLKTLKDSWKLKELNIWNTSIGEGLEYLPTRFLRNIGRNTKFFEKLKGYDDLQSWRKAHPKLINNAWGIMELENTLTNLDLVLTNQTLNETTDKVLQIFIFQTENKIKELKKQNEQYWEAKIQQPPYNPNQYQY
jgi:hypothetical protein